MKEQKFWRFQPFYLKEICIRLSRNTNIPLIPKCARQHSNLILKSQFVQSSLALFWKVWVNCSGLERNFQWKEICIIHNQFKTDAWPSIERYVTVACWPIKYDVLSKNTFSHQSSFSVCIALTVSFIHTGRYITQ